jgi:UDP-N-acetylmuramoyl-L-alanyl-D-glutamate--2,6-diaminopimelate ligase
MSKTLQEHLDALPAASIIRISGDPSVMITAPFVESDRDVLPGGVFVARKGRSVDGHEFIQRAIERGAAAVIGERAIDLDGVPYIQVRDAHRLTGMLASSYYDFPSRRLVVFGVTGTNGKTTTTHLLHSILKLATGGKAGYISTIAADFGDATADTGLHVTTPQASEVQDYLARMVRAGMTHVVLEMTSHGLEQGRVAGVEIDVAVVTNVTHEHLDYHGTYEAYRAAKGIMLEMLSRSVRKPNTPKISVLNADDSSYEHYRVIAADQMVSYGIRHQGVSVEYAPGLTHFTIGADRFAIRLVGQFNVYNALAAVSAARAYGIDDDTIRQGLLAIDSVSGRMQRIDEGQHFLAVVDFAHTPDALEKAIMAARTMVAPGKRVIAVFGCAGLRDVEKRRMMPEIAAQLADISVLTAEDPRTESLDAILAMMAEGCIVQGGVEGETFIRVPDRGEAIYRACQLAEAGDVVIACGKGHEQSMCFGTTEYPWDDRDAMRAALRGAPLQTLPTAGGTAPA